MHTDTCNEPSKIYIGRDDVSVEIFIREAVKSRKDYSFLTAGSNYNIHCCSFLF